MSIIVGTATKNGQATTSQFGASFYFWKFVHNFLIHPLMAFPWKEPKWLCDLHDWTAKRCPGAG